MTSQTHYIRIPARARARRTGRIEKRRTDGVNLEGYQCQVCARSVPAKAPGTNIRVIVIRNFNTYFRTVPGRVLPTNPSHTAIQEATVTVCTPLRHARAVCSVVGIGFGPTE
ncbi:MAG: hypothetical protein ACWGP1_16010 [Syntrophobacteria bacterium]